VIGLVTNDTKESSLPTPTEDKTFCPNVEDPAAFDSLF
jgi:hypothetical protein